MRIKLLFIALLSMIIVNAQTKEQVSILFEDSFESYTDFSINDIGDWIMLDLDKSPTAGVLDFFWQNKYKPHAFIVFNPTTTIGATKVSEAFFAKTGSKYMGSWGAIIPKKGDRGRNDDWLISPPVRLKTGTNEVSFWVKSLVNHAKIVAKEELEEYTVGVYAGSGIPTGSDDFTLITAIGDDEQIVRAPLDWSQKTFNLDAYANQVVRIGIHSVSNEKHFFMLDDFKVTATTFLKTQDFFSQNFTVFPNPAQDIVNIAAKKEMELKNVQFADVNGRIVKNVLLQQQGEVQIPVNDLSAGMYFISIQTNEGVARSKFFKN